MPGNHGIADGTPITDVMIETMADEAERGYDVAEITAPSAGRTAVPGISAVLGGVRTAGP